MKSKLTYFLVLLLLGLVGCNSLGKESVIEVEKGFDVTNEIKVYDFDSFEKLLYTESDTTYIINFWAMWCVPCVKELPFFIEYANKNKDQKTEVIFVSLDFVEDLDSKLKPFLKELNMSSRVVLLDEADANSWIDKISPIWSGSIPFTIVFTKANRAFYEHDFESLLELENEINQIK